MHPHDNASLIVLVTTGDNGDDVVQWHAYALSSFYHNLFLFSTILGTPDRPDGPSLITATVCSFRSSD